MHHFVTRAERADQTKLFRFFLTLHLQPILSSSLLKNRIPRLPIPDFDILDFNVLNFLIMPDDSSFTDFPECDFQFLTFPENRASRFRDHFPTRETNKEIND